MRINKKDCDSIGCNVYTHKFSIDKHLCERYPKILKRRPKNCYMACCVLCMLCKDSSLVLRYSKGDDIKLFMFRRKYLK